ncbi:MAG: TolC family protein [Phycisphaerales bacterium]
MNGWPLVLSAAVLIGGCAPMRPGLGFDDVQQSVASRAGVRVHWRSGGPEDAEVQAAVQRLLASELGDHDAVQIALLNNRDLQATYEELNLAQADLVGAGLLRNPVFSGEVRWSTSGGGTGVALDVAQDFLSLLFLPMRRARAEAESEAAKLRVTARVLDLVGDVRTAYYDLQAAEQLLEMRRTVFEATEASYDLAKRLRQAGNNRDLDVSNERALHEQARVDLAAAEAMAALERERLSELMGVRGEDTQWKIAARLPEVPAERRSPLDLEKRALANSLDLGIARREIETAARTLGLARPLARMSEGEVGVAAEREPEGDWSVGPAISLPIPIFDQGQGAVGSARARLAQARERHAATAVRIRSRVRAAYLDSAAARDRAVYYERVLLPLRQKIVDETQLQYNGMQVGAFQLLQARRDQIETGAQYIESLRKFWKASARLDQILSGRLAPLGPASGSGPASEWSAGASEGDHR